MCRLLVIVLLLVGPLAAQRFQRDSYASPVGALGRKGMGLAARSLEAGEDWGNSSIQSLDDNVFVGFMGLSKRQTCNSGTLCQGGCCSAGNKCVPTNPRGPCCPTDSIVCSVGQCCLTTTDCCSNACCNSPRTCCGDKGCCESGQTCCKGNACCTENQTCCDGGCCLSGKGECCGDGCCEPEETCCGNGMGCCRQGAICGKDGYCSTSVSIPYYSKPTPTPTPSKQPEEPEDPEEPEEPEEPPAQSSSPIITSTPTPACTHNPLDLVKRVHTTGQCAPSCPLPTPAATIVFSHVTKSLPIFPPEVLQATPSLSAIVLDNSRLLRNMCMGMQALTGSTVQSVILTRHKDGALNSQNRRTMCKQSNGRSDCGLDPDMTAPDGVTPLNVPSYLGDFDFSSEWYRSKKRWYLRTECDEFPFASSCEGGSVSGGSRYCLSAWENRWGSWQMGPWSALSSGQRCKIVIDASTWDCGLQGSVPGGGPVGEAKTAKTARKEREKKVVGRGEIWSDGYAGEDLYMDALGPGQNGLAMTLGDLDPGNYTIRLNITRGSFSAFYIVDGGGSRVSAPKALLAPDDHAIDFTLAEPIDDAFLAAETREEDVGVEYVVGNATKGVSSGAAAVRRGGRYAVGLGMMMGFVVVVGC